MKPITLFDLLDELQSFIEVNEKDLEKAAQSSVTDVNNKEFKDLVKGWTNGLYDEDPLLLRDRLIALI